MIKSSDDFFVLSRDGVWVPQYYTDTLAECLFSYKRRIKPLIDPEAQKTIVVWRRFGFKGEWLHSELRDKPNDNWDIIDRDKDSPRELIKKIRSSDRIFATYSWTSRLVKNKVYLFLCEK